MATWPATLPAPLLEGYSAADAPVLIRTPMASGPQRVALTSIDYMTTGQAALILDETQCDTLRSFIAGDLAHGANWIDDLPLDTGQGVFDHHARISGVTWTVLVPGRTWKAAFSFETDERNSA